MIPPELILAFALIATGFLLLAVEMFFPSGVCFALSLVGFVAGIVLAFLYDTKVGWMSLGGVAVSFVGMLWLIRYCWTRTGLGRRMVLRAPAEEATLSATPLNKEREGLIGQVGLEGAGERVRPRPHDLRHTLAVRTLLDWYHAGEDVDRKLPLLSTFLGHVDPASTYWYLEAVPELMALIKSRLERLPEVLS